MGFSRAGAGAAVRRFLRDERGIAFLAPLLPFLSAILPTLGAWAAKTVASIATPVMIVVLLSLALNALGGNTREIFFNLPEDPNAPPLFLGLYDRDVWDKLITPGAAAFWALGGLVTILGVILTGYEWYYSSLNPRARASLMETLWFWVLGSLALGLYPMWASFLLWTNDQIVRLLGQGLPQGIDFEHVFVMSLGESAKDSVINFLKKAVTTPGDLMAASALALAGQGVRLYFTIFLLIRKVVLVLLLWTGPILGGAVLFFRRGAPIAGRYWLEFLSSVFVQTLLALCAVFALNLISTLAGGAGEIQAGNISLKSQLAMLAAMMAMMPATNLLRNILGLPVGGIGLAAGIGTGMIAGFGLLVGQALQRLGGLVLPMPPAPIAGGAVSPPSGFRSGGGAAPVPVGGGGGGLAPAAPAVAGIAFSGAEHVRRAREAGQAVSGWLAGGGVGGFLPPGGGPEPITPWWSLRNTGPIPAIDRAKIQGIKDVFASGGEIGGALAAGIMAMGMGGSGPAMFMAPAIGGMAGARVGSALGTAPALYQVAKPTTKAAMPFWKLAPEVRRAAGVSGQPLRRFGPDIWASWRTGQALVSGIRPGTPQGAYDLLVARNWWAPVFESFGVRFHEPGAGRPATPAPGGPDPWMATGMMAYYSHGAGEVLL